MGCIKHARLQSQIKLNLSKHMKVYTYFIGVDIGKEKFVSHVYGEQITQEYENNLKGITRFLKEHEEVLKKGLCVVEATGGYEMPLLFNLHHAGCVAHRASGRQVKSFIRSYGHQAKTDVIDAKMLARYSCERHVSLEVFVPSTPRAYELYELAQRRKDLKEMLVMEKCRLQSPRVSSIKKSIQKSITFLENSLKRIDDQIHQLVDEDETLKKKRETLITIPGIGKIIAQELLILLPELGTLTRRQIASLVGLAPIARDSGQVQGYRRTGHGRMGIKPSLFLAAMAARRSKTPLKNFYESLIARGKKKMVALTALMRKIIVIANARIKALSLP